VTSLTIQTEGAEIVRDCLPKESVCQLITALPEAQINTRSALDLPSVAELARSATIRKWIEPLLGEQCFAVRALLFNKSANSNWKVAWHQDCVIAVRERINLPGWGPWSKKLGILHVRPPVSVLNRMVAIRIHLDDCGIENGPLRILPGTHTGGLLSDSDINALSKEQQVACVVHRGDAILMRPLLVHASSVARGPANRRVIHIEFAADELPEGLIWHDRVGGLEN
jgi:ectoine hydroxylase-related dioxygenase (phytanoyl-CoA dioxygenase family)